MPTVSYHGESIIENGGLAEENQKKATSMATQSAQWQHSEEYQ